MISNEIKEFLGKLSPSDKDNLYRFLLAEKVRKDAESFLSQSNVKLREGLLESVVESVVKAMVYDGGEDSNLSQLYINRLCMSFLTIFVEKDVKSFLSKHNKELSEDLIDLVVDDLIVSPEETCDTNLSYWDNIKNLVDMEEDTTV
jgi:hypothetical protein